MGMNQMQTIVVSLLMSCAGAFGQGASGAPAGGGGWAGPGQAMPQQMSPERLIPGTSEPREALLTVTFAGGTLGQLLDAIGKTTDQDVNVAVSREAMGVELPAMSFRNASVWAVLQAASKVADAKGGMLAVERVGNGGPEHQTYAVQLHTRNMMAGGSMVVPRPQTVRVASIADVADLGGADSAATLLSALTATLEMEVPEGGAAAEVKFHKESSLLIIRGSDAQQAVAAQVIEQLRGAAGKHRSQEQRAKVAEQRLDRLQMALDESKRRAEIATKELEEFLKPFKDGVPTGESARYAMLNTAQMSALEAVRSTEKQLMEARMKQQDPEADFDDDVVSALKKQIKMLEGELAELRRALEQRSGSESRKGK